MMQECLVPVIRKRQKIRYRLEQEYKFSRFVFIKMDNVRLNSLITELTFNSYYLNMICFYFNVKVMKLFHLILIIVTITAIAFSVYTARLL